MAAQMEPSSRQRQWRNLPADVLSLVAAFSAPGTLGHMRGVCKQWRSSINSNVQRAALHGGSETSTRRHGKALTVAPPMPNIFHGIRLLHITDVEVDAQFLRSMVACTSLSSLALECCVVEGDALSALPNFRSLSHLSLSCSSFSNPETFRHICRCGALWRNNGARDRSCASDPGQHCAASSDLEDSFQGEYVVTRSMSECHPAPVHADAASFMRSRAVPETSSMGQLPIHSANSTDGYPLSASGAQCYRSLLSLDVSGISFSDGDLASILSSHPKLVALAVSTGAAANTGMRAATDLCDLRHLDISFLGFARGGEQFASDATKATALSETLTALCNAATKRITAGLEARSPSVDPSQEVLAALCDNAPWWRAPSNPAASSARKSGIPHATVEPFATFHLAIDLQLLIAFSRSWLRRSFATIPDRGLTVRHHTPFTTHPGAPSSHKEDSEQSLIAAVSPEPSRILHVLLPEIIVGPARLSHFELCGIETTESLLRHLLRIETPPMAAIRLHNYDPDRPTASSVSPDPKHCECSCSGDDDNTQSDGTLIAEQLQNSSLCDSLDSHNTPDKKAKLEASVSRNMECASSPFDTDDAEEHKSAAEQCSVHRAVPSHPLQGSMSAVISGTMPRCSCNGSAATPLPPAASTSGGKRRSMDGDWVRHRDAEQVPSGRRGGRRYAGSRSTEQGDSAQTMPRRSTLQSVLLAARWRRPSSAILRQIVDVHGEGLRCLHLSDLAGVNDTVMRRLQSHAPHLSSLTLSGTCPVTAAGIQVLRNMNLQSLHLCKLSEPQIGDQALQMLSSSESQITGTLLDLSFEGFAVSSAQLECLPLFTKLNRLSLNGTSLSMDAEVSDSETCDFRNCMTCSNVRDSTESGCSAWDASCRANEKHLASGLTQLDCVVNSILSMLTLQQVSAYDSNLSEAFGSAATRLQGQCRVELLL